MEKKLEEIRHHPWCNYFYNARHGCKMCEKFYILYPFDWEKGDFENLMKVHFPTNTVVL